MVAKIHSVETFGAVDGPGIRFVVFMQGCPMRCMYCHNPDTWDMTTGKEITAQELFEQICKYKHYFGKDGGVTLSGGEPLLQLDFAIELFTKLKEQNIHACIDTSGIVYGINDETDNKIDKLLNLTDLVLLDIKHIDNNKHKKITGKSNANILKFASHLDQRNIPVWIRYVLVPTLTDDMEDIKQLRRFLDTLNNIKKIEVLPYHTMGVNKYESLNLDYKLKGINSPTKELVEVVNKILTKGEVR